MPALPLPTMATFFLGDRQLPGADTCKAFRLSGRVLQPKGCSVGDGASQGQAHSRARAAGALGERGHHEADRTTHEGKRRSE